MLTQNDILTVIYLKAKESPINDLNGDVYKKIRPTESKLEDCVISLINGVSAKFLQDGGISIKIFFNDLKDVDSNTYYEDTKKGGELEQLLFNFSEVLLENNSGISFEVQTRELYIGRFEEEHQHYAILRMNFKISK